MLGEIVLQRKIKYRWGKKMIGRATLVSVERKADQRPRDLSKVRQWM